MGRTAWRDEAARERLEAWYTLRIPPLATDEDLRKLTMPVLVLGEADDISFPGDAVGRRMKAVVPHADAEVIAGCKHCPPTTPEFRAWLAERLTAFLTA